MASTSMAVRDAAGNLISVAQEDAAGVRTPRSVPEVAGSAISASNPMPVGGQALGAPADLEATGDGSAIAILKRLRTLLGTLLPAALGARTSAGSLSVTFATDVATLPVSGTAAAGSAPSTPPLAVSGLDGGGLKRHLLTDTAGALQVGVKGGATVALTVVTLPAGTATQLVAANANRRYLALSNIGTGLGTVGFANTITAGNGWPLAAAASAGAAGGNFTFHPESVHTGAVWGVSAAGTTVAVLEG